MNHRNRIFGFRPNTNLRQSEFTEYSAENEHSVIFGNYRIFGKLPNILPYPHFCFNPVLRSAADLSSLDQGSDSSPLIKKKFMQPHRSCFTSDLKFIAIIKDFRVKTLKTLKWCMFSHQLHLKMTKLLR